MSHRDLDRWWWRLSAYFWGHDWTVNATIALLWFASGAIVVLLFSMIATVAHGAPLTCPPVTVEPPPLFMQALEATESGGQRDPNTARGDDGESWGRYQVSIGYAALCMRIPAKRIPAERVRIITALLDPERNLEWARRHAAECLAQHPPPYWSKAYWCYNGGPGALWKPNDPNVLRFARNLRRLVEER